MSTGNYKSLRDVADSIQYGYTASASSDPVGPRFLRITDIVPSSIDWDQVPYCSIEEKDKSRYMLKSGDIVIARTGATVGYAKLIRNNPEAVFASYLIRIRVNPQKANPNYVGLIVDSDIYKRFVFSQVGGSAQPNANAKVLSSFRLYVPHIDTQTRIVSIISSYDDLIENNNRRIQLLEQAARHLYKEWFVAFRFPGHEHVKITNGVPEGWRKMKLGKIADITMGQSPKSVYYNDEGNDLPFHQGVTNFTNRFPVHKIYCTVIQRTAEPHDILFSVRAPVGRINRTIDKIVIGRGLAAIHSKDEKQSFLYYALSELFFKDDLIGVGSIYAAITKKDLYEVTVLHPPKRQIETFSEYSEPIDSQIEMLHKANQKLSKARNLLLPRLMNGEIEV